MKNTIFLLFVFIAVSLSAEWISIRENTNKELFEHRSGDRNSVEIGFSLNGYEQKTISERGEEYQQLSYFNEGEFLEIGKPDLPRFTRMIAIPDEGEVSFEVISYEEEIISNINIYPQQELQIENQPVITTFVKDEKFYTGGEVFPGKLIELGTPAILRDYRIVNVTINPFQFDPLKNQLRVIKNIDFVVNCTGSDGENTKTLNRKKSRNFETLYSSLIINYESTISRDEEFQQPTYLFIYPTNTSVEQNLQYLSDWKHQKGFNVISASTSETGSSLSSIRNYIQDAYDNWENPPEFVCLIGDANGSYVIPTGHSGYGEGDHYYTLLEGNDILADVFIGRLSFNSISDLQTIISKILYYEKQPYLDETNWYDSALLVADAGTSGQSCIYTKQSIKEMIGVHAPNINCIEVYSGSWVSQMSYNLNLGVSYFNYRGYWGMSGWDNYNTNNLTNGFKLPVVVTLTCGTGDFENETSISEAFLRAGTVSVPKGGIAAVGTATIMTHTCFNNCVDGGIFYGIFADQIYNMGGALTRGKLNLYINYPNNPDNAVDNFSYWNNLMGDPGMELWTAVPEEMIVTYNSIVPLGSNLLEVTVQNSSGVPIENAWVTALMGDDEIFSTGYTDSQGMIELELEEIIGTVDLTVTKHNFIPHLGTFEIAQSDYFINVDEMIIDDDNAGTSSGNNNGLINPGEDIELGAGLKNFGSNLSTSVNAVITTDSDYITITDDTEEYGDIPAGSSVLSGDDFDFSVVANVLGGSEIPLDFMITDGVGNEWTNKMFLPVNGPNLIVNNYIVIDDNNGIFDPGETVELALILENIGSQNVENIAVIISCTNENISIVDDYGYFGTINAGEQTNNIDDTFELQASSQILNGVQIPFQIQITNDSGFDSISNFIIDVGEVSITDPLGPDDYGYYCYDDEDDDYDLAPVYFWQEIDPAYGGNGTSLNLYDNGDLGDSEDINLPFNLIFYGRTYNMITVCSNGWLVPGGTEMKSFMNWSIPGPLGPSPMIAPFWDDLQMGSGDVYYYFDENAHCFIVEWSHVQNDYNNAEETFQVIIYDTAYYPTITGDNDILIQYETINNNDQGSYGGGYVNHGEYATVGLEDHTGMVGLEYTFSNRYPTAAKHLQDNMAILFTTDGSSFVEPPILEINQEIFHFVVQPGETDSQTLEISNLGEANLIYSISKNYQESIEIVNNRDFGGPDNYGYQWIDSNEPNGPEYQWRDISELGSVVSFSNNDQGTDLMPIGFTFNYYGIDYNQFRINPNGWIGFGDDNTEWINTSIPSFDAPRPAILPFWDDLNPLEGGNVLYYSSPDSLVVWFDNVIHYVGNYNGTYDFEVIIYPDSKILFQYRFVTGDTDTATIGIQNESGTDGLQIVYNSDYVENEMAILITKVIDWIDIEPASGMVPSGETDEILLSIETDELGIGEYLCNLKLYSNDPDYSLIEIPVNLIVMSVNPEIDVSVSEIDFGTIYIGDSATDSLTITNLGEDLLTVFDIYSDNEDFIVDTTEFELSTGQSQQVYVTFSPTSEGEITGDLLILSNDPDESTYLVNLTGTGEVLISSDEPEIVFTNSLNQNYPNPFRLMGNSRINKTTINFSLSQENPVLMNIYNILGQKVKTIIDEILEPGIHQVDWDGTDSNNKTVTSGIYFYRFSAGNYHEIKKMLLIR